MSAEWLVHSALVSSFDALGLAPVAYEEREFSPPPDNTIWYALFNLPSSRDPETLGDEGEDEYVGVFQVDVNGPTGEGVRTLIEAASVITANYTAGKRYVKDGQVVKIRKSEMSMPRKEGARLTISVSVYWTSMIPRS